MDKDYYQEYYIEERSHWWFLARLKILKTQVSKIKKKESLKILNVGVATGATSVMLQQFGDVYSIEYDVDCVNFVRNTLNIHIEHGSILELPYDDNSFDLVCAFDVIEHIENDSLGVKEMMRVCKDGGYVTVTVPAFMSLWSEHDVINHHFRRYTQKELTDLFKKSGSIKYTSYFNSLLFIPIFLARILSNFLKSKDEAPKSDFKKFKPGILNSILYNVFLSENNFLRRGIKFPFGVSIFLSWKK